VDNEITAIGPDIKKDQQMEPAFVTNGALAILAALVFVPALIGLVFLNLKN
jgi:hypothetical protein